MGGRRTFKCTFCDYEVELFVDTPDWAAPQNWLWINHRLVCDQHRRIVVNHGRAKGRVVRVAPLPAESDA